MNTKHNVHLLADTLHRTITNITITPSAPTNIRQNLPGYPSGGGTGGGTKLNDDGTPPATNDTSAIPSHATTTKSTGSSNECTPTQSD